MRWSTFVFANIQHEIEIDKYGTTQHNHKH